MAEDDFSLRNYVKKLDALGLVETIHDQTDLTDISRSLQGADKAVLFTNAGPEKTEIIGNVMGSRKLLGMALDVEAPDALGELLKRLKTTQKIVEIASSQAPVHQVILEGDDADLTKLPIPFQHGLDGGPYISAAIDFTIDEDTGWTNVGVRRLMLRGRREAGIDAVSPSDLRAIYEKSARKGERLPIAFVIGAHPLDYIAATQRLPVDELSIVANLRGAELAVVKCITSDLRIPADAEIVLEGYLDERGHVEKEGPYGEFLGYYGKVKENPVFHLTAMTMRDNALFQTATIGGKYLSRTDTAQLSALRTEATVWQAVQTAIREPIAICATASSGGMFNLRLSLRQRVQGEARNAIAAAFGSFANVKNVFVVDDDVDVFSDEQMDWALATRFQPERDLFVETGFRTLPLDPSLDGMKMGSKAGYDLTLPFGKRGDFDLTLPEPPEFSEKSCENVVEALSAGPLHFGEIMGAVGSRDGREVMIDLDALRQAGKLTRNDDGKYALV